MLIRNMPGFSTFYAYSTHKQKIRGGDRKKVEILNPTPRKIFHKIGATLLCSPECSNFQIYFSISSSGYLVP